jgi:hypothetical protein
MNRSAKHRYKVQEEVLHHHEAFSDVERCFEACEFGNEAKKAFALAFGRSEMIK